MKKLKLQNKALLASLSNTQLASVKGGTEQTSNVPIVYTDKGMGASILKGG